MALDNMKMSAQLKGDAITGSVPEVKVLMSRPMETGLKKNDYNQLIPAHFVQLLTATLNGKTVLEAQCGMDITKNPHLSFRLKNAKIADKISVTQA